MSEDMRKTQEMPVVETVADIYRTDPLGIFTHRRAMDCRDIDSTAFQQEYAARKRGDFTTEGEG